MQKKDKILFKFSQLYGILKLIKYVFDISISQKKRGINL